VAVIGVARQCIVEVERFLSLPTPPADLRLRFANGMKGIPSFMGHDLRVAQTFDTGLMQYFVRWRHAHTWK